jgi:hypothetical protein
MHRRGSQSDRAKLLHSWQGLAALAVLSCLVASPALAGKPRWVLVYYRQFGNHCNAGNHTIESHLFREDGSKGAGVGVTNLYNSGIPIFGAADPDGWNRITTTEGVFGYDLMIFQPGVATDRTPNFYWQNAAMNKFYSFGTHWMHVLDEARVNPYPQTPVYHYDRVSGLNSSTLVEPPGASSDAHALANWADYQAQTFVVPPGINRIVSAQAYVIRNLLTHFQYKATIHEGSPTGPQVGPAAISRCVVSIEFFPVCVNWPLHAVSVTPGQTYALKLEPVLNPVCATEGTNPGFNAYATLADTYPDGMYFNGPAPVPGRDLLAMVVGVGYDIPPLNPAVISLTSSGFDHTIDYGQNLFPPDVVTLGNTGGAPLDYTISGAGDWLVVNKTEGRLDPAATQDLTLSYFTATLKPGVYSKALTIEDPMAANSPQTVVVQVTVEPPPFAPVDFDHDTDVDQEDFGVFQACYSGQGITQGQLSCAGARLDMDDDVDQADFEIFLQKCLSGPGVTANTACNS